MGNPAWKDFDYSQFPAIKCKQFNINRLKEKNPIKFNDHLGKLENLLKK